ncbi:MAG: YwaF family protein [Firmicutes bacterium]|nr:YwaF family protein [Bacillota bacterium]
MLGLYIALIFVIAGGLIASYILFKNKKARQFLYLVAAICLITIFFFRFLWARPAFENVFALQFLRFRNLGHPYYRLRVHDNVEHIYQFLSRPLVFISMLLIWFNMAGFIAVALSAFFNIKIMSRLIAFIFAPIALLSAIFFFSSSIMLAGENALNDFNIHMLFFALELGLVLGLSTIHALYYFKSGHHKDKIIARREWKAIACVLPVMLLVTMPNNVLHVIFGFGSIQTSTNLSFSHRLLVYFSLIVPFAFYFGIKKLDSVLNNRIANAAKTEQGAEQYTKTNYDYVTDFRGSSRENNDFIRYCLIFISVATMIVYSETIYFINLGRGVDRWPLHLCNTAMFIVPVCLIFKLKKFFYFTFFINVLGALLAMLMPDYGQIYNLSARFYSYWQNHYYAFFLPLLCVALGAFERPKFKHFGWSMIFFTGYFISMLFINAYTGADFFFLNSDFIIGFFPDGWIVLMDVTISFYLGNVYMNFYILFQAIFFVVFFAAAALMWLLYEYYFNAWYRLKELFYRKKCINMDTMALMSQYNLNDLSEPINLQGEDMLKLIDFSKKYGSNKHFAVENANLEVSAGEIFGFLGPNGAGKSTIIKSLVGLQPITSGQMQVCGFDVEKQSIETKKRIGYVPDHYALYEKLTGREYVNYVADLYGIEIEKRDELIEHYLNIFQLAHAFDSQMRTYSHGMKQKIAIMAALVHSPKVWILDEPLTGLDPNSIYQVKQIMREHAKNGNIVMFSSHIMDVVENICDKIAIIRKGKILVQDKPVVDIVQSGISLENYYMYTIKHGMPPENNDQIIKEGNTLALEQN